MSNNVPAKPELNCEVPDIEEDGYYTDEQSFTNVARKDKFILVLNVPCALKHLLQKENRQCRGGSLDRLQYSIWGYSTPEISIPKQEVGFGGEYFQFSTHQKPAYEPISINFTVDNKYDNYFILWKWLEILKNNEDSCITPMPEYMTTISILGYDEYPKIDWSNPVVEWNFTNAFPTLLGSLDTSQRDTGELETSFSFAFSQVEMKLL